VFFIDENTGTAVGDAGTILRTTNGGNNWAGQSSDVSFGLLGVFFTDANHGTVVGTNGTILNTTNGGVDWVSELRPTYSTLTHAYFVDPGNGFIVGSSGTILSLGDGTTSVHDDQAGNDSAPTQFVLEQNYPNPFNPATTFRFSLPERTDVELAIYDLNGQLVIRLVNEPLPAGFHEVRWDAHGLASGVYFARLSSEGFTRTHRVTLLK
jgi:hypothetical protein